MATKGLWLVSAIWTLSIGQTGCAGSSGSLREIRESMRRLIMIFFEFEVDGYIYSFNAIAFYLDIGGNLALCFNWWVVRGIG